MLNFLKKALIRVSFYPRTFKSGNSYLYCRVVVNGQRQKTDFSTQIKCKPCEWNRQSKYLRGKHHLENNNVLEAIETELKSINSYLSFRHKKVSPEMVKKEFFRTTSDQYITLLPFYKEWAENQYKRNDIAKTTKSQFITKYKLIEEFLLENKNQHLLIENLKPGLVKEFIEWLKNERNLSNDYIAKNLQVLKTVLNDACINEIISGNPLRNFTFFKGNTKRFIYLDENELHEMETYRFHSPTLQKVNDCFLFQAYTGLSYIDIKDIDFEERIFFRDRNRWLKGERQKTKTSFEVPLILEALTILEKYHFILPVLSNKSYNSYLKEIAGILNIKKKLTTHVARKTAGMIWLNKYHMSLECVQRMLGHASIKTTEQFYAKILPNRLNNEITRALGEEW